MTKSTTNSTYTGTYNPFIHTAVSASAIGSAIPQANYSFAKDTNASTISAAGSLHVSGDANFLGKVTIQGVDVVSLLTKLEERLAIMKPNPELEERWVEMQELSKRYKELEKELFEKEKVWEILKK